MAHFPQVVVATALLVLVSLLSLCSLTSADYRLSSLTQKDYGWEGALQLTTPGPYGQDIRNLSLSVWFETESRLRVTLRDATAKRWEIPASFLSIPSLTPPRNKLPTTLYTFTASNSPDFTFAITRRSTGFVLFNTSLQPLHYSPQFLQIGTSLPSNASLYGLGERILPFRLPQDDFVIWTTDWANPTLKNLYGHHPVYYRMEDGGHAHAVVFWNSNMQDINLTASALTYKTIGGVLDFYFLLGPTPLAVATQYTEIVGRPWMPPVWAMGWHQCKWGYVSANYTLDVVKNYSANGIPLDTVWNDIDWMRDYVAFTYNDEYGSKGYTAPDVAAMNAYLTAHHQHHVQIVDPNIPAVLREKDGQEYLPYTTGKALDIFVRHPANDTLLFGKQWPPMTVAWPDWTNPAIVDWWTDNFRRFFDIAGPLSGVWLDMNEPSNFCAGQISKDCIGTNDTSRLIDPIAVPHAPGSWPTDIPYPPYQPGKRWQGMEDKSFNISSHHYLGQHYNVKEFWGMMEQRATRLAMERLTGKRAFSLSRSTFMGSGGWGAHWLGDNNSDWGQLVQSIQEVLSMGLYGIVMVGADICGFGGDTNAELCARWTQVGALYPFARNHASIGSVDQEAYRFGEPYVSLNRNSIKLRYSLLPYYTTLYVKASVRGWPVWRSLMMEFPQDEAGWAVDRQFMLGEALMGIPILEQGADDVDGYLPNGDWFNYFTYTRLTSYNATEGAMGQNYSFCSSLSDTAHTPLIQRGGTVVYTQTPGLTTVETMTSPYTLRVALDHRGQGTGTTHLVDPDALETSTPTGLPHYWTLTDDVVLSYNTSGVAGRFRHEVAQGQSQYNVTGQAVHELVIAGLDVPEGGQVTVPTYIRGGKVTPAPTLTVAVHNGAVVLTDSSNQLLLVSEAWTLAWDAVVEKAVEGVEQVRAASE